MTQELHETDMSNETSSADIKQEVRDFYDQVGWQQVGDNRVGGNDRYQNARYEDLRPVAQEYIHRCHLRVGRFLKPQGRLLLDAGSGPIQYPEYLEYSRQYTYRVCADISITALKEARNRIGEHGLFVVMDIANLPFKSDVFEGVVSLHTIHHLPEGEHLRAYGEIYRVLAPACQAAIVNGWPHSRLMAFFKPFIQLATRLGNFRRRVVRQISRLIGRQEEMTEIVAPNAVVPNAVTTQAESQGETTAGAQVVTTKFNGVEETMEGAVAAQSKIKNKKGTFTSRHDYAWIQEQVGQRMPIEIRAWRSVSVRFTRALIHPWLGGKLWLRLLFWLEDRFPAYFGKNGQYPLIIVRKE